MNTKRKYYYLLGDAEIVAEETQRDIEDDNYSVFQLRLTDSEWIICRVNKVNIENIIRSLNNIIEQYKI